MNFDMKKFRLYLDTSVISFLFADDAPEKKEITKDFFDLFVLPEIYETFISQIVIQEIVSTSDDVLKNKMLEAIQHYPLKQTTLQNETRIIDLAEKYCEEKLIPKNKYADALHIAITTVNELDFLISWNYRHLANVNREQRILEFNKRQKVYCNFRIITPIELIGDEDEN